MIAYAGVSEQRQTQAARHLASGAEAGVFLLGA